MRDDRLKNAFSKIKLNEEKTNQIYNQIVDAKIENPNSEIILPKKSSKGSYALIALLSVALICVAIFFFLKYKGFKAPDNSTSTTTPVTTTATNTQIKNFDIEATFALGYPDTISKNISGNFIETSLDKDTFKSVLEILKKYNLVPVSNATIDTKDSMFVLKNSTNGPILTVVNDKYLLVESEGKKDVLESPGELLTELIKNLETVFNQSVTKNKYSIFSENLGVIKDKDISFTNKINEKASPITEESKAKIFEYLSKENNLSSVDNIVKTEKYIEFKKDKVLYRIYDNGLIEYSTPKFPQSNYYMLKDLGILSDFITEANPLDQTLLSFKFNLIRAQKPEDSVVSISQASVSQIINEIKRYTPTKADIANVSMKNKFKYDLIDEKSKNTLEIFDGKYLLFKYLQNGNQITQVYELKQGNFVTLQDLIERNFIAGFYNEVKKIMDNIVPLIEKDKYYTNKIGTQFSDRRLKDDKKAEFLRFLKLMGIAKIESVQPESNVNTYNISVEAYNINFLPDKFVYIQSPDKNYYFSVDVQTFNKLNSILSDENNYVKQ